MNRDGSSISDGVSIRMDGDGLPPTGIGEYVVPLIETSQAGGPVSSVRVEHQYVEQLKGNAQSSRQVLTAAECFEGGSYFRITALDPMRKRLSGRFRFIYPIGNPFLSAGSPAPPLDWQITLSGDFKDVPYQDALNSVSSITASR